MVHLTLDSPFRPPNWRWQRAQALCHTNRPSSRLRDDVAVLKAREFLLAHEKCDDEWQLLALSERYPALYPAREIYARPEQGQRGELEARLLTGDTPEEVAASMGLSPELVRWYEQLFFQVRDRLGNVSWIIHQVLGTAAYELSSQSAPEALWRLFAYVGGREVLQAVMMPLSTALAASRDFPSSPEQVRNFFAEQMKNVLSNKGLISLLQMRCRDDNTRLRFLDLCRGYHEIEKAQPDPVSGQGSITEAIGLAISNLGWAVGATARPGRIPRSVEPRALDPLRHPVRVRAVGPVRPRPALEGTPGNGPGNGKHKRPGPAPLTEPTPYYRPGYSPGPEPAPVYPEVRREA